MEIKFNSLQQATIGVSGSDITYECMGNASISGNTLNSFESGNITKKVTEHILPISVLSEMGK